MLEDNVEQAVTGKTLTLGGIQYYWFYFVFPNSPWIIVPASEFKNHLPSVPVEVDIDEL